MDMPIVRNYEIIRVVCIDGILPFLCLIYCSTMLNNKIKIPVQESQQPRYSMECELANVLIAIATVFIACHLLKLFLNVYMVANLEQYLACSTAGKCAFETWNSILWTVTHLMVTVNSVYIYVYIKHIKSITLKM